MSKIETVTKKINQAEDLARKIWLAGLGAYGKGYDEAQDQYTEATKLFNDLVDKGEKLEGEAKQKIQAETDSIKSSVETRVADVRSKLGLDKSDSDEKIEELSAKIDALTEAVAKMAK